MSKMTRSLGNAKLRMVQHAPTILTVAGIGALIASGVVAAMRTEKAAEVVTKLEDDLERWEGEASVDPTYSEAEHNTDKLISYKDAAIGFVRVYGPAIALAAVGSAAVLYSHGLMKKRNAAMIAAYGILERGYDSYRERVRNLVGEEAERKIHRGDEFEYEIKDGDVIFSEKADERVAAGHIPNGVSEYAAYFGPENPNWSERPEYNLLFLRGQERYMNHQLKVRGHVMLNDVYDALRLPRTTAGSVVGWVFDGPDGYVSFGLPEQGSSEEADYYFFFDQNSKFLLDFNVDGVVYDKIDQIKKG